jgi:hypothetical protein
MYAYRYQGRGFMEQHKKAKGRVITDELWLQVVNDNLHAKNILSRVLVCMDGVLDWMIGFIAPYTITQFGTTIQHYRYSIHFPVHSYTCTSVLSLPYAYPCNGFISHTVTSNHTWSLVFTAYFLSCYYFATVHSEDSTQFNSKLISW